MLTRRNWLKAGVAAAAAGTASVAQAATGKAAPSQKSNINKTLPSETFDCVILGAGTGSLVTAIEAFDRGLKPVVLEKMSWAAGNSIFASGGIAAWGTDLQKAQGFNETKEAFRADMMKVSQNRADPALVDTYVENIGPDIEWLQKKIGVKFEKIRTLPWPLLHRLIRYLLAACDARKIPVRFNTKGLKLITDNQYRIVGVECLTDDGLKNYMARDGVVIGTGGFSANRAMLCRYMGGPLSRLVLRGSQYVTGENVSMTEPLGAMLVHMDQFHCGPIVENTHANPNFVIDAGTGLDVNCQGQRFMDEVFTYTQKSMATATKTAENKAYHIIDANWPRSEMAAKKFLGMNSEVIIANTPEELARKMGLKPEVFTKLFAEYNKALADGKLKDMNPPCSLKDPKPLNKPPYYAFPFQGGITATFGGPKINSKAQIVSNEGVPFKGLYAVGNAAGTAAAAGTTDHFLADRHVERGVKCESCHVNGDTSKPVRKAQCLACHKSYEELAKKTANVHPNPHFNHYGERDCTTCHKGHQQSTLSCSQCHKFNLKTP